MSFRKSFFGFRKKVKDKLSKIGDKTGEIEASAGDEGFYHSAPPPQSEPGVIAEGESSEGDIEVELGKDDPQPGNSRSVSRSAVGIGHGQEGSDDKVSGRMTDQERLHLHPLVQTEGGSSQGRRDVDGKQAANRADPSPQLDIENKTTPTPSISRGGESESNPVAPDPVHVDITASKDKSDWKHTASSAAKLLLRTVERASDVFPPLKSAAAGLCAVLDNCERTVVNKKAIESLGYQVEALVKSLCVPVSEGDINEEMRRKELERKLEGVRQALDLMATQKNIVQFLNNPDNAQKLNDLVDDIREAVMDYQTSLQRDIYENTRQIIDGTELLLLDRMRHVADAGYLCGDRQGCMKGTRKEVLFQLEQWSRDEQDKRAFWLNGLAGTGKSTIAQTFAEMCFADGKLGASFFCSRDFDDRSNLRSIFPTLAFQLAHRYPRFRQQLLSVLKTSPDVGRETLCSQMEKLVVGPFQATKIQTLIVIDALDECRDEEPASAILSVLSRYMDKIPLIKFFITGRPEPRIRSGFRLESLRPHTDVLKLHEVEPSSVDHDIKLFLKAQFVEIAKNRSDCSFVEDWPGPQNIDILCKKAAGFFIYASTVVKFVASHFDPPDERLDLIVSLPQDTSHEGRLGIDLLYTQVLSQAFPSVDPHNHKHYSHFRSIVGAVLLILHPLSINTLSDLINCGTPSRISTSLRTLHSVLLVPDNTEGPVRIFHKSFPDFLTDPQRCTSHQFFIDPPTHHKEILFSCLSTMKERLKKNICKLDDNAALSMVKDLPTLRTTHIGDALEYSCKFWTGHLAKIPKSSGGLKEVHNAIDDFFATGFLFWIEVLILTRNIDTSVHALNDIEQWCILTGVPCKWTSDSKQFILDNFDLIQDSPSRMYNFALTLCPSSSWVYKCYTTGLSSKVKMVVGPARWGTCIRTVLCPCFAHALAHWKNTIAVGSSDNNINILDVFTGSQIATLSGHTKGVRSLVFSSNGAFLVSGSDDTTTKLWDVQTGGVIKTLHGHTKMVLSVSISADDIIVASGSFDKTIRLWNTETGDCLIIEGHKDPINTVSFSPINPQLLLSLSGNSTIQQWSINGHKIGLPIAGRHVAFSPDGTQFISCNGTTFTIHNTDSRVAIAEISLEKYVDYCHFSPDGRYIAVVASSTIYLWETTGPEPYLIQVLIGHTDDITSLIFSSPLTLISASWDKSVKFWQIGASSVVQDTLDSELIPLNSAPIRSVSIQAKDDLAFSVDSEGVVRVWSILTGLCKDAIITPAKSSEFADMQMTSSGLAITWYKKILEESIDTSSEIYFWNSKQGKLQQVETVSGISQDPRISGDGSRVTYTDNRGVAQVWSTETGKFISRTHQMDPIYLFDPHKSKALVYPQLSPTQLQDPGVPSLTPTQSSEMSSGRPHLRLINFGEQPMIEDSITGKEVFQLHGKYAKPSAIQWDGQYLVTGYESGEVLILDFSQMLA